MRTRAIVAMVVLALFAGAVSAQAAWNRAVAGTGSSRAKTISAPTSFSASPATSTSMSLSWVAPTNPSPTSYTLTRNGGAVAGTCASITSASTSCTDTGLTASTTYSYALVAKVNNWTSASASTSGTTGAPAGATKLVITSSAISGTATTSRTLGPITVQQQNASNAPVNAVSAVTVNLSSNSTGTSSFAATSGGPAVTSVTIPTGLSSVTFFYADTRAGTPTITASATSLTSGTQQETINAGTPTKFGFTTNAFTAQATASPTIGAITVAAQDQFSNPANVGANTQVNLSSNSTGTKSFSLTSGGATVSSVTITSGTSSKGFFYGDTKAGTPTITASGSLTSGSQLQTITAGAPVRLEFWACAANNGSTTQAPCANIAVGNNGFMDGSVAVVDSFDNLATVSGSSVWSISISSDDAQFVVTLSPVSITGPANVSSTTFHVKYNGTGTASATIKAHAVSGSPAVSDDTITVSK